MGVSRLVANGKSDIGKYKMVFLDYLQKAEDLCRCKDLLERCEHYCDMRKAYGGMLVTVLEYRDEFLYLCETLRERYGLVANFEEAFGRVEMDYEIRREEEAIAYDRLKRAIHETFGSEKVVQIRGKSREIANIRALLLDDDDAAMRRKHFRRLLMREGDPFTMDVMAVFFLDEVCALYDNKTDN